VHLVELLAVALPGLALADVVHLVELLAMALPGVALATWCTWSS
jgi:hypothetical protein